MFRNAVALVLLSSVALSGFAKAQGEIYRIPISDLDLTKGKDKARFDQRVEVVARQLCDSRRDIVRQDYRECLQAVRDEANENLQIVQRKNETRMATVTVRRH